MNGFIFFNKVCFKKALCRWPVLCVYVSNKNRKGFRRPRRRIEFLPSKYFRYHTSRCLPKGGISQLPDYSMQQQEAKYQSKRTDAFCTQRIYNHQYANKRQHYKAAYCEPWRNIEVGSKHPAQSGVD